MIVNLLRSFYDWIQFLRRWLFVVLMALNLILAILFYFNG